MTTTSYLYPKSHPSTPTKVREEVLASSPTPLSIADKDLRRMQAANRMTTAYFNTHVGDYNILSLAPSAPVPALKQIPLNDDLFYVPNYFDAFEIPDPSPMELEFDPPLTHYAELRGGLPMGYVWIPPSSPEPMPRDTTPEQAGIAFVTPRKSPVATPVATTTTTTPRKLGKRKAVESESETPSRKKKAIEFVTPSSWKRATTAEYQQRFRSPLSCSLSPPPSGLLTPEPQE